MSGTLLSGDESKSELLCMESLGASGVRGTGEGVWVSAELIELSRSGIVSRSIGSMTVSGQGEGVPLLLALSPGERGSSSNMSWGVTVSVLPPLSLESASAAPSMVSVLPPLSLESASAAPIMVLVLPPLLLESASAASTCDSLAPRVGALAIMV
jgi:hypothetical protein